MSKKFQNFLKGIKNREVYNQTETLLNNLLVEGRKTAQGLFSINEDVANPPAGSGGGAQQAVNPNANTWNSTAGLGASQWKAGPNGSQGSPQGYGTPGIGGQYPLLPFALVRRTQPYLVANNFVGVQPMKGPSGVAISLKYKRAAWDAQGRIYATQKEAGWNDMMMNPTPSQNGDVDAIHGGSWDGASGRNWKNGLRKDPRSQQWGMDIDVGATSSSGGTDVNGQPIIIWTPANGGPETSTIGTATRPNAVGAAFGWGVPPEEMDAWDVDGANYTDGMKENPMFDPFNPDSGKGKGDGVTPPGATQDPNGTRPWGAGNVGGRYNRNIPTVLLEWGQVPIYAYGRSMAAAFSLSMIEDAMNLHNFDVEKETLKHLQYLLIAELDRETIGRMKACAYRANLIGTPGFDPSWLPLYGSKDGNFTYTIDCDQFATALIQERYALVLQSLIRACNDMRLRNRQGAGNAILVTPNVLTILQSCTTMFTPYTANVSASTITPKVGTLIGGIDVYIDQYNNADDVCVVGYKGRSIGDAGLFYCPYILGVENRAIDPHTFAPRIGVRMRYAFCKSLLGAENYYSTVAFKGIANLLVGNIITT